MLLLLFLLSNTSCIKYKTKYSCENNCQEITIKMHVNNASNVNVLANNHYEILLLEKFSGSTQNNRVVASGNADQYGNFSVSINCDTQLLNTDNYYLKVDYDWDVNSIKVCYNVSTSFKIEEYPTTGIHNMYLDAYKKMVVPLEFTKTSTDSMKYAYFYIEKDCYSKGYSLYNEINKPKQVATEAILNNFNYIKITSTDTLGNNHLLIDSFFVDPNFSGKSFNF